MQSVSYEIYTVYAMVGLPALPHYIATLTGFNGLNKNPFK